jgi:hypothetical protein
VDSPKCVRCSLVGICLPEETHQLSEERTDPPPQLSLFDAVHNGRLKKPPARETTPAGDAADGFASAVPKPARTDKNFRGRSTAAFREPQAAHDIAWVCAVSAAA